MTEFDLKHCSKCSRELKATAAIPETPVIKHILNQLGLFAQAPPRSLGAPTQQAA